MKILLCSHVFFPSTGGLETVSEILADEFLRLGHEVRVLTRTPYPYPENRGYEVIRQPTLRQVWAATGWCNLFFHNNISLGWVWTLLFFRRPWVVAHHTWICRPDGSSSWQDKLKKRLLKFAMNLTISDAVAVGLPVASLVLGDPYREDIFHQKPTIPRDLDLVYLGRLVSDKGVDTLLQALAKLHAKGEKWRLTLIGDGEERQPLESFCLEHHLSEFVTFQGVKKGPELAEILCRHRILVIPSRWEEPFGIVALEGIACGCAVVGSEKGGLRDAIGPCGLTFPNGRVDALVGAITRLMQDPLLSSKCLAAAPGHLAHFTRQSVAQRYLKAFAEAVEIHARSPIK